MPFSEYKNLGAAIKEFGLHYQEKPFEAVQQLNAPQNLAADIAFNLSELAYDGSEAIICETLIFPVLKETWKGFTKELMLWSHQALVWNEKLSGIPDYMFSKQSEFGKIVLDKPFVAVVEAKKDDFTGGWGQCCAEMYAATQVNQDKNLTVFGIVSNGRIWEFAALRENIFVKYKKSADINQLDGLYSILSHILSLCKAQLLAAGK